MHTIYTYNISTQKKRVYTVEKSLQYMEQERQLHKLLQRVIADVKQPAALFMLYIFIYMWHLNKAECRRITPRIPRPQKKSKRVRKIDTSHSQTVNQILSERKKLYFSKHSLFISFDKTGDIHPLKRKD